MASDYEGFAVTFESSPGVIESVGAGVDVHCREHGAGSDLAESPLSTDANGEIAAGTFAATSPGDVVHFRVENVGGIAMSISQITT